MEIEETDETRRERSEGLYDSGLTKTQVPKPEQTEEHVRWHLLDHLYLQLIQER